MSHPEIQALTEWATTPDRGANLGDVKSDVRKLLREVERLRGELKFAGDEANRRGDKLARIQQILNERVGGDPE